MESLLVPKAQHWLVVYLGTTFKPLRSFVTIKIGCSQRFTTICRYVIEKLCCGSFFPHNESGPGLNG